MVGEFRFRGDGGGAAAAGRWRRRFSRRPQISGVTLVFGGLLFFLLFVFLFAEILRTAIVSFPFRLSDGIDAPASLLQCSGGSRRRSSLVFEGQKFLWYAPHSGFSNQVSELRNAVLFAAILNRTLVVPPVLDHHAVFLGSCPKFRVSSPSDLRASVWDHSMDLLRQRRFVSMVDIVDLSSVVSSSMVRAIDFREFVSALCGIDLNLVCTVSEFESLPRAFNQCKDLLSRPDSRDHSCAYGVEDDCRTTVWTYAQATDGILDPFQPDEELKKRKKISFIRRRRDVYKALGPGSEAEEATVLAFGSLFTSPYKGSELSIDIHDAPTDPRIQSLLQKLEYLPFAKEILDAGKEFALSMIKEPFLCAQLRLLDGQFKNHWKETFLGLRQKIELIMADTVEKIGQGSISVFIMTDLPDANWTGTYLAELSNNSGYFKLFTLSEDDKLVVHASEKLISGRKRSCHPVILPSILLYVQEAVCSCASLGFVGTSGSTIAENIEEMRKNNACGSEKG